ARPRARQPIERPGDGRRGADDAPEGMRRHAEAIRDVQAGDPRQLPEVRALAADPRALRPVDRREWKDEGFHPRTVAASLAYAGDRGIIVGMRFSRYQLRTTDAGAARAFYAPLLGDDLDIVPLHAEARARGAPAHWLGLISVGDVERTVAGFVAHGATPLGPTRTWDDGGMTAVGRDPGGAVVGFTSSSLRRHSSAEVARHILNTSDLARTAAAYGEVLGWQLGDRLDLGPLGILQQVSEAAGERSFGAFVDIAGLPGRHP